MTADLENQAKDQLSKLSAHLHHYIHVPEIFRNFVKTDFAR